MCGSKKSAAPQVVYVPEPVYMPAPAAKAAEPTPAEVSAGTKDRRRPTRRGVGSLLTNSASLTSSPSASPGSPGLG